MKPQHPFLSRRRPAKALSEFDDRQCAPDEVWRLVAWEGDRWCREPQSELLYQPLIVLVASGDRDWQLEWFSHHESADSFAAVPAAAAECLSVLERLPPAHVPRRVLVSWHCRTAPESGARAARAATVLRGSLAARSALREIDVVVDEAACDHHLTRDAAAWVAAVTPALDDVSDPSWADADGSDALRGIVPRLLTPDGNDVTVTLPDAVVAFALRDEEATTDFRWALALSVAALARTPDLSRDAKQLPRGSEHRLACLRLYKDPGDALRVADALRGGPNPTATFKDWLHHDAGELVFGLGPHAGAATLDRAHFRGAIVPRCYEHVLDGTAVKPSPLHAPEAQAARRVPTASMLSAVHAAIRTLCAALDAATMGGDPSLATFLQPAVLPPTARKCKWCAAVRATNLKCSGCKAVAYCCRAHQTLDWKQGGHARRCKLMQQDADALGRLPADEAQLPSAAVADAATVLGQVSRAGDGGDGDGATAVWIQTTLTAGECIAALCAAVALRGGSCPRGRLVVNTLHEESNRRVYALTASAAAAELPPSGVLGDLWHAHAVAPPNAALTVRFVSGRLIHAYECGQLPPLDDISVFVHCGAGDAGLSFFDAFPRLVLPARGRAVLTSECKAAARATADALKQQAGAVDDAARARAAQRAAAAVISDHSDVVVGRCHDAASRTEAVLFANLWAVIVA